MVTEAGFAPYEYYDNNEIVGVDVEIAKEIASALGKKLVIKDVYFDAIINEIKSGKADFALAGMSVNEERKKQVDFSNTYISSKQIVIVRNDSDIKNISQINNKKIAVKKGNTQLLNKINEVIDNLKNSGKIDEYILEYSK